MRITKYDSCGNATSTDFKFDIPGFIRIFDDASPIIRISNNEFKIINSKVDTSEKSYLINKYRDLIEYDYNLYSKSKECQAVIDVNGLTSRDYTVLEVYSTMTTRCHSITDFNNRFKQYEKEGAPSFSEIIMAEELIKASSTITDKDAIQTQKQLINYCKKLVSKEKWLEALIINLRKNKNIISQDAILFYNYLISNSKKTWSEFKKDRPMIDKNNMINEANIIKSHYTAIESSFLYKKLTNMLNRHASKIKARKTTKVEHAIADFIFKVTTRPYSSSIDYLSFNQDALIEAILKAQYLMHGHKRSSIYGIIYTINYLIAGIKKSDASEFLNMIEQSNITIKTDLLQIELETPEYIALIAETKACKEIDVISTQFENSYNMYLLSCRDSLTTEADNEASVLNKKNYNELSPEDWEKYYWEKMSFILNKANEIPIGKELVTPLCYFWIIKRHNIKEKYLGFEGNFLSDLIIIANKNKEHQMLSCLYNPMFSINYIKKHLKDNQLEYCKNQIKRFLDENFYNYCEWEDSEEKKDKVKRIINQIIESNTIIPLFEKKWPNKDGVQFNIKLLFNVIGIIKSKLNLKFRNSNMSRHLAEILVPIKRPKECWREHMNNTKNSKDFDKCCDEIKKIIGAGGNLRG